MPKGKSKRFPSPSTIERRSEQDQIILQKAIESLQGKQLPHNNRGECMVRHALVFAQQMAAYKNPTYQRLLKKLDEKKSK